MKNLASLALTSLTVSLLVLSVACGGGGGSGSSSGGSPPSSAS